MHSTDFDSITSYSCVRIKAFNFFALTDMIGDVASVLQARVRGCTRFYFRFGEILTEGVRKLIVH